MNYYSIFAKDVTWSDVESVTVRKRLTRNRAVTKILHPEDI